MKCLFRWVLGGLCGGLVFFSGCYAIPCKCVKSQFRTGTFKAHKLSPRGGCVKRRSLGVLFKRGLELLVVNVVAVLPHLLRVD